MNLSSQLQTLPVSFFFLIVDNFLDINLYPYLKNFYPIYAYKNPQLSLLKSKNIPYFCLEENGFLLEAKNSGRLLAHPKVIEYIGQISTQNQTTPAIIPFKPSAKIEKICQKHSWIIVASPAKLNRFFEDKIQFQKITQNNNLPTIPSKIIKLNQNEYSLAQKEFGQNLVMQTHFGWGGNSTFLVASLQQALKNAPLNTTVKLSPHLQGYSLLNNCCLTPKGLIQSPPALQYTGLAPYTHHPFTTVGRQWPCLAPNSVVSQVKEITQNFSQILAKEKFLGFFGLDFFVHQNQVFLLECNPRLTASFALYTQIEISQNIDPLFFFHLLSFVKPDFQFDINKQQRFDHPGIIGSEITYKNKQNQIFKKVSQNIAFSDTLQPIIIKDHIQQLLQK